MISDCLWHTHTGGNITIKDMYVSSNRTASTTESRHSKLQLLLFAAHNIHLHHSGQISGRKSHIREGAHFLFGLDTSERALSRAISIAIPRNLHSHDNNASCRVNGLKTATAETLGRRRQDIIAWIIYDSQHHRLDAKLAWE